MPLLKYMIQFISIYRASAMFVFILFYPKLSNGINSLILITAITSDLLDGFLAKRFNLTSTGGKLLDLFSDKYLNCIVIIFLIIEEYSLLPLVCILTKEIFVLSFRSIQVGEEFVISTNRYLGGIMSGGLWFTVLLHINSLFTSIIPITIYILGVSNFLYLIYKIVHNRIKLCEVFKN